MKQLLGKSYIIKLIWIFIIGSLCGYFIETGYYFFKHGVFMSKQGLLYGHIKPIYGFASVLITLFLSAFVNKNHFKIYVYGCFLGGAFEYLCSLVLQYFFHTQMWHYHNKYLNINGRVNLLYLPVWGLAALLWLKFVIPYFNKIFDKLSEKIMKYITIVITSLIILDFGISIVAVRRMKYRNKGIEPKNHFQVFLDKHYTDEFIKKRIPYLKIVD